MNIWILSQDEMTLCECKKLFVKGKAVCCNFNDIEDDYAYLGVYDSTERAKEIIKNDIAKHIINLNSKYNTSMKIFEMPKE